MVICQSSTKDRDFKDLVPGYEAETAWGNDIMYPIVGYPITGLESDTWYFYRVRAYRIYEFLGSMFSSIITAKTAFSSIPVTVTILPKTEITQNSLRIYWNKVAKATQYAIEVSTSSTFATGSVISLQTDSTAITVSRLLPQTKYYFRVRGINAQGAGNFSYPQFIKTLGTLGYTLRQESKEVIVKTSASNIPERIYGLCANDIGTTESIESILGWLDSLGKNSICISRAWITTPQGSCTTPLPNGLLLPSTESRLGTLRIELCTNNEPIEKYSYFSKNRCTELFKCANNEFYYYTLNTPVSVRETEINASSLPQFSCVYGSFSSEIQIQCRLGQRSGILGIELFDVLGRKIYTSEQNVVSGESNISISTSQIGQGVYFARCVFQSGVERHIQTLPLVVQH